MYLNPFIILDFDFPVIVPIGNCYLAPRSGAKFLRVCLIKPRNVGSVEDKVDLVEEKTTT